MNYLSNHLSILGKKHTSQRRADNSAKDVSCNFSDMRSFLLLLFVIFSLTLTMQPANVPFVAAHPKLKPRLE
jgi:hypothetical protein